MRFLTGASRRDHISPVLRSLHWLPVKQRVDYKLANLVYKSLRGQAPSYLVDDCQLIVNSERPQLRSAHANVLIVPRTNTLLGDRSFSVAGPRIWNSLPYSLQSVRNKETKIFFVISSIKLGRFWWNSVHNFLNKFAATSCKCLPPHLNSASTSTLPCET